ncbi:MAG: CdaR family protein [Ruminococcus sp.]|nr:CdaR family protein [Ruminococcus sp.]
MNKGFFSRIFRNKIFLIILSFIISLTVWVSINMGDYGETSYVVSNIPITINLPENAEKQGLKVFNNEELKGSVTVSGNRSIIGSLTADDIQIVPEQTDLLTSAGSYSLSLVAKKTGASLNYTVDSVSPSTVYIKLDRNRKITQKIEQNISYTIPNGYYGTVLLSEDEVSISGPETEIKKIDKVVIKGKINKELSSSYKSEYKVKLLDSFGEELTNTDTLSISPSTVTATVSVLQMKEVGVDLSSKNAPTGIDLTEYYTIEPDKISLAGESDDIKNISRITTDTIDFSSLKNNDYNISKGLDIPNKCIDINSVNSVNVKLNLSSMKKKYLTIDNFRVNGLDDNYSGEVTTASLKVTIYGTKESIDKINKDNIISYVDLSDIDISVGSKTMPIQLSLQNIDGCWIYGSYSVVVDITE